MKKLLQVTFLLTSLFSLSQEKDYSLAKVGVKRENIYIFIGCTPVQEYDVITQWDCYWNKDGKLEEKIEEALTRAKKKYNNVDGIIFKPGADQAEFIKFIGREITGGGFKSGDKVIYKDGSRFEYGEVAMIDNIKNRASIKYLDKYGDERKDEIPFEKLTHINKDEYQKNIDKQNEEISKHKFVIGEKITWSEGNKPKYGEIQALNDVKHDAKVNFLDKYGDTKTETFDYLKIYKTDENKYKEFMSQQAVEIEKHKFVLGETVSFIDDKITKVGEVTALNGSNHKASVKYLNVYGDSKTSDIHYFDLEKISKDKFKEETDKFQIEISKYKFTVGQKVNWNKKSAFKSEIIPCEVVSLDDLGHRAVVKFLDKEGKEKQEKADYLDLTKVN